MIVISAGHHPEAVGATYEDFSEFPETGLWAGLIVKYLTEVYQTRAEVAPFGTLGDKVRWIKERHAAEGVQIAIEIHFNSAPGAEPGKVRGCETLHYPGSAVGKEFAEKINPAMAEFTKDRGCKEGCHHESGKPLYFLQKTPCPALILEPEFIQNVAWIKENRAKVCAALAEAIYEAVEQHYHSIPSHSPR